MADSYRKGHDVPRNFMRKYKSLGNIGPSGEEVFAEIMALEAGSIGGGGSNTQYTEADVDATITGTAVMWEDAADTLRAASAAKPLPVNVVAGGSGGGVVTQGALDATAGNWKVSVQNASLAVTGTFFQATQPVSIAAAVPVTDNAGSLTIDAPVGTPVFVRLSDGTAALTGQKTMANSLPVALASDQSALPITDNAGSLTVDAPVATPVFVRLSDGAANLIGQKVMASSIPVVIASDQGALTVASHAVTNAGTFVVQENGAALTSLQLIDDTIVADDAAFTIGTTKVSGAGYLADETATDSVDEGDIGIARMTLDRKLRTVQTPHTAGGLTTYHLVSAATTNAVVVKASAGQLFGWYIYNSNAAARKVAFHNASSAPTAGASIFFTVVIPPLSAANVEFTNGIEFTTGIAHTFVTGLADTDATAVAANDLVVNLFYK